MAWKVAKSILKLRSQVDTLAPNRSKSSDGTIGDASHTSRSSDHNPHIIDGGIGVVSAIDFTNDPTHGCSSQQLVDILVASKDPRIKYIIWNRQIISSTTSPWVWRKYSGKNPHDKHCHLSVKSEKKFYDDETAWNLKGFSDSIVSAPNKPVTPGAPSVGKLPRLIIAVHNSKDAEAWKYSEVKSAKFMGDHFELDRGEFEKITGSKGDGADTQTIRMLLSSSGLPHIIATQHLRDKKDPRAYIFIGKV